MASNPAKRSLIALRRLYDAFKTHHNVSPGSPKASFTFYWAPDEETDKTEIDREEFLSNSPDERRGGHPKRGIYYVEGHNGLLGEERVVYENLCAEGHFEPAGESGEGGDFGGGGGGSARDVLTMQNATARMLETMNTALARKDGEIARMEQRMRDAMERENNLVLSMDQIRQQVVDMRIARDAALQAQRDVELAYASLEAQIEEEREEAAKRKESITAVFENLFDRAVQQWTGQPGVAATHEAMQQATDQILDSLIAKHPRNTLHAVHGGVLNWESVYTLMYLYYGDVFPDPMSPPPPDWEPDGGWVPLHERDDEDESESDADADDEDDADVVEAEAETPAESEQH